MSGKYQCSFVVFDIESFYQSISIKLFDEALSFAKLYHDFTSHELELIMHSRNFCFCFGKIVLVLKKEGDEEFDIQVECYDDAEMCKLVEIYTQNQLFKLMNKKDFGLYRDGGVGILRNTSGHEADRKRKSIIKIFTDRGLSFTSKVDKKIVDVLDVRFNLNEQTQNLTGNQTMNPFTSTYNQTIHQT